MTRLVLPHYVRGTLHSGILAGLVALYMERKCVFHPVARIKVLQWGYLMGLILPVEFTTELQLVQTFLRYNACAEYKHSGLIVFV